MLETDTTTSFGTTDSETNVQQEALNQNTDSNPTATESLHMIESDVTKLVLFETTESQTTRQELLQMTNGLIEKTTDNQSTKHYTDEIKNVPHKRVSELYLDKSEWMFDLISDLGMSESAQVTA